MILFNRIFLVSALLVTSTITIAQDKIAIRAQTIYTMAGEPINNGVILVEQGKIKNVGSNITIPDDFKVIEAKIVTPGLIDAHTVVGLAGYLNQEHDQDQLEKSNPIQPELRAIDAYNGREVLVGWLRQHGVTSIHTGHGPGALISGQTMLVKTLEGEIDQALISAPTMLAMTLGSSVSGNYDKPGTRAKGMAMLREALIEAVEYDKKMSSKDKKKHPSRDLKKEVLVKLLKGEITALMTAHKATEILAALRLQEEFGFKMVLDGASEAPLVIEQIKTANIPVILHPAMIRPSGDAKSASLETAAKLRDAGIEFALQSGYEGYVPKTRVILFEAAMYAANGLTFEEALASITITPAKILGLSERVGSLEQGKDADLVLFDGDPFEYTSHVCTVLINGKVVSDICN